MIAKVALPSLLSVLALSLGCSAFTGPTFPYVAIMIEEPLSALAGRTFLVGSGGTAGATYIAGPNSYESASTGRVVIGSVDADSTIHGSVNLSFNSRRVLDMFHADWIHRGMLCG